MDDEKPKSNWVKMAEATRIVMNEKIEALRKDLQNEILQVRQENVQLRSDLLAERERVIELRGHIATLEQSLKRLGEKYKVLEFDRGESGRWTGTGGSLWQAFYLRWLPAHCVYGRVRVGMTKSHNAEICLQAAGTARRECGGLEHSPEAIAVWVHTLRTRCNGQPIAVCLERKQGPMVSALRQ